MSTPLQNEKKLLQSIARSDEAAFTKLFHSYRNKIFTVALKITESEVASEEIVQDVFLKVWLNREKLPMVNDFAAWRFIIARNHTYNHLKQVAREEKMQHGLQETLPGNTLPADTLVLDKNYEAILQEALSRLSTQQRKVYQMPHW